MAYAYVNGIGCLTWSGDLLDIEQLASGGVELNLRLSHSEFSEDKKRTELIIILTTILGAVLSAVILYVLYKYIASGRVKRRHQVDQDNFLVTPSEGLNNDDMKKHLMDQKESPDLAMYNFSTLAAATDNFSEQNKLGAGGFGPVYKGKLEDGQEIAVKRLSTYSGQGIEEFQNEILLISKMQHRNLVKLLGYCIKGDEKLLIYEYLKNRSLDTFLFDKNNKMQLDWTKWSDIIHGIARGLLYLHRDSSLRVIHRDLKASNILLDDKMSPKISDFGLARGFEITQELANTRRVVGTLGYMSPEYAIGGLFSEKSDVFSFGVLLLEIISGSRNTSFLYQENHLNLLGYAWRLWDEDKGLDLMDERLSDSCPATDFMKYMQIGLLCVQDYAADRPTMSVVVLMLTSDIDIPRPKQPTYYQGMLNSDHPSQSTNTTSKNDVSLSVIEGR